jgi:hypothetical protein
MLAALLQELFHITKATKDNQELRTGKQFLNKSYWL